jgi:hypothetical protein
MLFRYYDCPFYFFVSFFGCFYFYFLACFLSASLFVSCSERIAGILLGERGADETSPSSTLAAIGLKFPELCASGF